jgi:hypothetical protein
MIPAASYHEMIETQPKPLQRSIQNLTDTMTESHKSVLAAEEKLHNWTRAKDSGSTFTPTSIKTKTYKVQNKAIKDDPEYMGLVAILEQSREDWHKAGTDTLKQMVNREIQHAKNQRLKAFVKCSLEVFKYFTYFVVE